MRLSPHVKAKIPKKLALQKRIGKRVRTLRTQHGWSQTELAHKIQMSKPWLQNLEYGSFLPPVHYLLELAAVLQTDLGVLCGGQRPDALED